MVEFLCSVAPITSKKSQELISMDIHTSGKTCVFPASTKKPI
jgi:nonsense-mediated mRNA decay protein 3